MVGDRVKLEGQVFSVEIVRTGVMVLSNGMEVMAGDLKSAVEHFVPTEQLLETPWTAIENIVTIFQDQRFDLACGTVEIVGCFKGYTIHFAWKIEFGGGKGCDVLSFEGEPRLTSPLCDVRADELVHVLEILDESLNILDTIHGKWSLTKTVRAEIGKNLRETNNEKNGSDDR